jgi:hypothetical protein
MKYLKIFENFDSQLSEEIDDILNSLIERKFIVSKKEPIVDDDGKLYLIFDIDTKFRIIDDLKLLIEFKESISDLTTALNRFNQFYENKIKLSVDFQSFNINLNIPMKENLQKLFSDLLMISRSRENDNWVFVYVPHYSKLPKLMVEFIVNVNTYEVTAEIYFGKDRPKDWYVQNKQIIDDISKEIIEHFTTMYDLEFQRQNELTFGFHYYFK